MSITVHSLVLPHLQCYGAEYGAEVQNNLETDALLQADFKCDGFVAVYMQWRGTVTDAHMLTAYFHPHT